MFRNLTLIICCSLINNIFSQQDCNISINLNNVDSLSLFQTNYTENELIKINNDTSLFFDTSLSNLFHVIYDNKKYYFYLNKTTNLSLLILNDKSLSFSGTNADFSFFLNDYFDLRYQIDSLLDEPNIDLFEISLYSLISNDFVNFFHNHKLYNNFQPYCRDFFKNLLEFEYFNAISSYLIDDKKDIDKALPSYKEIDADLLDWNMFTGAFNNTHFYNVSMFQTYIYNSIILFSISNFKYISNQSFRDFSINTLDFLNNYVPKDLWLDFIHYYLYRFWDHLDDKTCLYFENYLKNNDFDITTEIFKKFYNRPQIVVLKNHKTNEQIIESPFFMESLLGEQTDLKQFKGKFLYIDIWASWCGPCRKQFPYAEKLKHKFSKRQLKKLNFLYISIDNDRQKWKESIKSLDLSGYHFISPSNELNSAGDYFEISSIPRYILMNKEGEIIDHNAKRPSDETLLEDLLNLIK